jgi:hypothetical protein
VIPCTVLSVASDFGVTRDQLVLSEANSWDGFDGWQLVRKSGNLVDFRWILMFGSSLPELRDYQFSDSILTKVSMIYESMKNEIEMYL